MYDVQQVAIFGSVLTGRPHNDVDIAVEVQPCHTCKDSKLNGILSKITGEKIDITFTDSIANLFDKLRVKDFIVVD